ncbi:uncharacterized protein LOC142639814 [Castanea sativa]|uniref:uncharacterized protein LOC142639814 n=1 Tax=Castanea sativa TaxID=21020 RepID=UPI003F649BC5
MGAETCGHLFWGCDRACEVWNSTSIPFDAQGLAFPAFVDFIWHLIFRVRVGQELLELVAMVAWCMWFNMNEVWLGKPRHQGLAILQRTHFLLDEFQMVNLKIHSARCNKDAQWSPPKAPLYKLNVDGATFESSHSSSVGQPFVILLEE